MSSEGGAQMDVSGSEGGAQIDESGSSCSSSKKLRALIVDDNEIFCRMHKDLLEKNCNVKTVTYLNGEEAVSFVRSGETFDIVFLDQKMPIMDGPQTVEELRGLGVKCPIIGLYESSTVAEIKRFMDAGLDKCLLKPLTVAKLKAIVENLKMDDTNLIVPEDLEV